MSRLTLSVLLLGLLLVFWATIIWPRYQILTSLRNQAQELGDHLRYLEEYLRHLQSLAEDLKERQAELAIVDAALPEDPQLPTLLQFLQVAASQNGLIMTNVSSFSLEKPVSQSQLKESEVRLVFSGTIESLLNFLKKIERSGRIIEVTEIGFQSPRQANIFSFDIALKVYSR